MNIDDLKGFVDQMFEQGPVSDAESMATLLRESSRLDAYVTVSVGEFDKWGAWALDGARSAAAWIAKKGNLPRVVARRLVRRGRALDHLPEAAKAWKEGDIGAAHVDTLEKARNSRTRCGLEHDEEMLVDHARTLCPEDYAKAVSYWEQLADPDGTEASAEERRNRRDVYIEPVGDM
ncbi:MAG TPA: DUF222 domain-containing protein, partial [Acidimicrobiales bacterium]|nr:DUF222 domain-containing protein [Acidimicrobiales bacterium]